MTPGYAGTSEMILLNVGLLKTSRKMSDCLGLSASFVLCLTPNRLSARVCFCFYGSSLLQVSYAVPSVRHDPLRAALRPPARFLVRHHIEKRAQSNGTRQHVAVLLMCRLSRLVTQQPELTQHLFCARSTNCKRKKSRCRGV